MNLEQQVRVLIGDAPKHGIAPIVIEKAIAPVLLSIAQQLEHSEYYLWHNLQEDWAISVLSQRQSPQIEKKVVYCFSAVKQGKNFTSSAETDLVAIAVPTIQILWRVFAAREIDSAIFVSALSDRGIEVKRQDLQSAIQQALIRLKTTPPDIA